MSIQQEKLRAIADKIRDKTGETEPIKPNDFVNKIDDVYEAGVNDAYDTFWDEYQQNGNRTDYKYAFANWTDKSFKPKYNMVVTTAYGMFATFNKRNGVLVSLPELLQEAGITIDFSKTNGFYYLGDSSYISDFGFIDCSGSVNIAQMFNAANRLETVSLKLKSDGSQTFNGSFGGCINLKNITIEGTIGNNISFSDSSLLTKESITSIINALSSTATGKTLTLKTAAVNSAFETSEGANDGSISDEWLALTGTKTNWTITLS